MDKTLGHEAFVTPCPCPYCGHFVDRASGVGHSSVPVPGDVTVCIRCGRVAVFAFDGSLRVPEPDEQQEIDAHAELQRVVAMVKSLARSEER